MVRNEGRQGEISHDIYINALMHNAIDGKTRFSTVTCLLRQSAKISHFFVFFWRCVCARRHFGVGLCGAKIYVA